MGVNSSAVTILILGFALCITGRSLGPPRISKDVRYNKEPVALEGDQLKLPCKVEGRPRPLKVWYRNGVQLNVAKDERYTVGRNELKIFPIKKEDEGIFSCHAHNDHGELWLNYTVSVYTEDEIEVVDYPEDECDKERFGEGLPFFPDPKPGTWIVRSRFSPVEMRCKACGSPEPTIRWYKNHQYIQPDVGGGRYKIKGFKLEIDSMDKEDDGNYTCVVENKFGKINATFKVEVLFNRPTVPVIVGPTNQTVRAGSDARLECKVMPNDLQHHTQWLQHYMINGSYKDSSGPPYVNIIQQSGPNISHPEILILKNVTLADAGWYTCLVSNLLGRDYQSAWLTVLEQRPVEIENTNISSDPSLKETKVNLIQSLLDSIELSNLKEIFDKEQITLDILAEMGHNDLKSIGITAFGHRHKIMKAATKFVSEALGPPRISKDARYNKEPVALEGHQLKLPCKVKGRPRPLKMWYRNGVQLNAAKNERYKFRKNALKIFPIKKEDEGIFSCHAHNEHGELWWNYTVSVYTGPPRISKDAGYNKEPVALEGHQLKLPCKVEGRPRPHKVWYRNGVQLNAAKDERYTFGRNALKIYPIKKEDEGIFSCHAHNEHGELWWNYTVSVHTEDDIEVVDYQDGECDKERFGEGLPFFPDPKPGTWIARSRFSPVEMRCKACGSPGPTIRWYKNHQYIQPYVVGGRYKIKGYKLEIDNMDKEDEGNYTCVVENQFGKINATFKVEVL